MHTTTITSMPEDGDASLMRLEQSARAAQAKWAASGMPARRDALFAIAQRVAERREQFAEAITQEVAKPLTEARAEVTRATDILRYYAGAIERQGPRLLPSAIGTLTTVERRPHGVVGLITPWNFPLAIPIWKLAPALAARNAAIVKPSPLARGTAALLASTLALELPEGLVAMLNGDAAAGEALIDLADAVSFTGSTRVGRAVIAASTARNIPVQAEMGGQNIAIVLPEADLDAVARLAAPSVAAFAGQKCTALRRVIVIGPLARADRFARLLGHRVAELAIGDPADPTTVIGPLISDAAASDFDSAITRIRDAGGTVITATASPAPGRLRAPAVITGVGLGHPVLHEEVFGPLCAVAAADDLSAAVRLANATPYRLVATVFGSDEDGFADACAGLDFGMIRRNLPTTGLDYNAPFGGAGLSSYGLPEQGDAALDFFTRSVTITH